MAAAPPPPPPCDIPSGCCSFTGPWTVTRSSLRMLCRVAAFCRPLRPVLPLVSFPRPPRCPTPPRVVPAVHTLRPTTPWVARVHGALLAAPPPPPPTTSSAALWSCTVAPRPPPPAPSGAQGKCPLQAAGVGPPCVAGQPSPFPFLRPHPHRRRRVPGAFPPRSSDRQMDQQRDKQTERQTDSRTDGYGYGYGGLPSRDVGLHAGYTYPPQPTSASRRRANGGP